MSDAYDQGAEARRRGDGQDMNPYDSRDGQHDEWLDGWWWQEFELG